MRRRNWILTLLVSSFAVVGTRAAAAAQAPELCPRPLPGSVVSEPEDLRSRDGVLSLDLFERNETRADGATRYCFVLSDGQEAPTLRLKPGDLLVLQLHNQLTEPPSQPHSGPPVASAHAHHPRAAVDPCTSGAMTLTSTNLHFHGLSLPTVCHQDEVLKTSIQATDPPFEYRIRIPPDTPPGLYWYHPHIHGFSSRHVLGGASGALVVEGIERVDSQLAGLPERVLVIRDQDLLHPDAAPSSGERAVQALIDRDGDALNTGTGGGRPSKDLSVNFVPVPYPDYTPALITVKPGERQLWRVLNASSVTYLNLALLARRGAKFRPEWLGVVGIDGVPLNAHGSPAHAIEWRNGIVVSPGSRVEFIVTAPAAGVPTMLVTRSVDTGPTGENDPNRPLLTINVTSDSPAPRSSLPSQSSPVPAGGLAWLGSVAPVRVRKLFFSEDAPDPANPGTPGKFYLTVDGQAPAPFDPLGTQPNIVVRQGEVEDWIIENRSRELHAFHIHQLHFQVLEWLGMVVNEPFVRDTINVPYFSAGMDHYPTVRLRMDFRDPDIVGTFIYHCHLLDHEDGGMMGSIRVEPANSPATGSGGIAREGVVAVARRNALSVSGLSQSLKQP